TKPTEGIAVFGKHSKKKKRTIISDKDMMRIKDYISHKNKHYLLACYVLFYCLVRPKEMSKIKIKHISITRQTLFIPDDNSKNRKDGTITLPSKVIQLMIDLNIFNYPGEYYLFSTGFVPGKYYKNEKMFRDFWSRYVRNDLKLPATYKFYSLKDTGITSMLRKYPSLSVRDQARHSSLLTTEIYTPHDLQEADVLLKNNDGDF
ncbi:MAG: site-specific integrase, partial [Fermentimonas sp.]|nr:site-specific integrase [Fermentimonas sp.]